MKFAEKVKFARGELLLSQKELADEIGVALVTVARWETKGLQPTFLTEQKFEKFCKSKGITFEEKE